MARVLGVIVGLLAELALIWVCCGNGIPALPSASQSAGPHFQREPQQTEAPTLPPENTQPPYDPVAGAMLIAMSLLPYDGPELWEKQGEDLSNVAALELWNAGNRGIRYAEVVVLQGERVLAFTATYIPPGGRVVVPEKDGQEYLRGAVADISYPVVVPMAEEMGADAVSVAESGAFDMTVTNVTESTLSCVRIFYKQYDGKRGVYVGGMTYSAVLTDLKPGESRNLMPYCYAAGYAKVVAIVVE